MAITQRTYRGKGSWYLKPAAGGYLPMGNISSSTFAIEEATEKIPDYENAGGGTADAISRIDAVALELVTYNYSTANLAIALRAGTSAVTAGAVASEDHVAYKGAFIPFNRPRDTSEAVTATQGATPMVLDTDYTIDAKGQGIWITSTTSVVTDGDTVTLGYTQLDHDSIEALTVAQAEFALYFDGLNEMRSNAKSLVWVHRVKFSPASALDLISDAAGQLTLKAEVLKDETITGAGLSQYITVRNA